MLPPSGRFNVGAAVSVDFEGNGTYFPGKNLRCNSNDGTYDIVYDDGDSEKHVHPVLVRHRVSQSKNPRSMKGQILRVRVRQVSDISFLQMSLLGKSTRNCSS